MKETFVNPEFLYLFLILPLIAVWLWLFRNKEMPNTQFSSTKAFKGNTSWKTKIKPILLIFRILCISCLIIALSRPRSSSELTKKKKNEGIDIVLVIDISTSMLSKDLKPNRLEALKEVASEFISNRDNDRIGLVVYAGESYTKVPVTSDKNIVLKALKQVTYGEIEDGTAIGTGLATAVNRLRESSAKSKVAVLMTDGVNNAGFIEPKTAADLAKQYAIKVYTIALGTNGTALTPIDYNPDGSFRYALAQVEIDEPLLKDIAQITGGKYFRAADNNKLEKIYKEIDTLEKSVVEELKFYQYDEKFRFWVLGAIILLILEFILRHTFFRGFL